MNRSQRWRERRQAFVPDATEIRPEDYHVDVISCHSQAKPFVERHHYSGSFPATRLSCGLFRKGRGGMQELAGVASFAVPMNNASIRKHTGLADCLSGVDLGRLVLLDDVPGNGESWFVARAFRLLRREKPEVEAVIAYSDPVRRIAEDGTIVMPGHVGMIYQALNAELRGRSTQRTDLIMPNGRALSPRALSKIRNGETGSSYAIRQVVEAGISEPRSGEDPADWITRLCAEGALIKRRHPGNWTYAFPLTRTARKAASLLPSLAYPKIDHVVSRGDVSALPLLAA